MPDFGQPLLEQDVDADPLRQIELWPEEARAAGVREPEAAALATASADGAPSVRMLLVKSFDHRGFVFFTNYDSQKGRELTANPHASLLFHWDPLGRQVRISGPVERTSDSETADYVRSRPRKSQLSALASPQSRRLESRAELERSLAELEQRYGSRSCRCPRAGAASACGRSRSSCGNSATTACTTACATGARSSARTHGSSSVSRRRRRR